jgi:hypothetical protein
VLEGGGEAERLEAVVRVLDLGVQSEYVVVVEDTGLIISGSAFLATSDIPSPTFQ